MLSGKCLAIICLRVYGGLNLSIDLYFVSACLLPCFPILFYDNLCIFFCIHSFCATAAIDSEDVPMSHNPAYVAMESSHQSKPQATDKSFHQPAPPDALHKNLVIAAFACKAYMYVPLT